MENCTSAKLNPAQQNYATHEVELLAGLETMLRHCDLLQGAKFKWVTDRKGLTYFLNQKNLSGRQARWLEKISSFNFEVVYVPGTENVVANALSCIYSNDDPGTVHARSEYTYHDVVNDDVDILEDDSPILAGLEACALGQRCTHVEVPAETGRPETSKEFAARVWDNFVLKGPRTCRVTLQGPREQKEGGSSPIAIDELQDTPRSAVSIPNEEMMSDPRQADQSLLVDLITSDAENVNLLKELCNKYSEDSFFKMVIEKPTDYCNFEVKNGLIYLKERESLLLCIPRVLIHGRSAREIVISEAHSLLAHLGTTKTLDYLQDHVWWPDMVNDVKAYCETCTVCKQSKPSNQKPFGLLNPLPIPGQPWESIGIDFIGPLPPSENRHGAFDSITVVICLLTSMVHLMASHTTYNARQMAELIYEEVYKHHRVPRNIISDWDILFTSVFWNHLHRLLGSQLRLSSTYHPQTDGSTERANQTITQMLRQCINDKQTDWVAKLLAIEFAINSAQSESTGFAPFFLNTGRMPRSMLFNFSIAKNEYP